MPLVRGSSSNQFAHVDEDPDSPQGMTRLFSHQRLAAEDTPDLLDQRVRNLDGESKRAGHRCRPMVSWKYRYLIRDQSPHNAHPLKTMP
ncbi:hypothetical protein NSPZN2_10982 [Nitrospira defluvii]|uniref:Transposase n=1 Tax=Nitrospira defluvii TaxID=330214 RepID=A0ABM8QN25_9BACT|nr:hypothetical protein NSPZN2_10982 [Nitrospira defluvii]